MESSQPQTTPQDSVQFTTSKPSFQMPQVVSHLDARRLLSARVESFFSSKSRGSERIRNQLSFRGGLKRKEGWRTSWGEAIFILVKKVDTGRSTRMEVIGILQCVL
jgi:hypothetical protein